MIFWFITCVVSAEERKINKKERKIGSDRCRDMRGGVFVAVPSLLTSAYTRWYIFVKSVVTKNAVSAGVDLG